MGKVFTPKRHRASRKRGLARWDLGQTQDADVSLNKSIALLSSREQQIYLLLTRADQYADYGQGAKARAISDTALNLIRGETYNERSRINEGHILNLRARLSFLRGETKRAREEIDAAIKLHQGEASILELAQDKGVLGEIQQQTGRYKEAIATLKEAAQTYKRTGYLRGQSDNLLKQASVFVDVNDYKSAEELIGQARSNFTQLNYQRGLGESEALTGVLIIRRANHEYIEHFHKNITAKQKSDASDEYARQTTAAIPYFENSFKIFHGIGYQRGIADAQDNLAFDLALIKEKLSRDESEFAGGNAAAAARTYEEIDDKRGEASAYGHWGVVFRKTDDYSAAIAKHERALQISQQIEFKVGIGRQLLGLGRAYYEQAFSNKDQDSMRKAIDYFVQARKELLQAAPAGQDELKAVNEFLKSIAGNSRR
jgi:tetratricopeptide (TPR) repeat protein